MPPPAGTSTTTPQGSHGSVIHAPRRLPVFPEHQALISQLPPLGRNQRSRISQFLCHLEHQGISWSTMAPQHGELRPALLEQAVNNGIAQHGLDSGTRSAINAAFGLALQGPPRSGNPQPSHGRAINAPPRGPVLLEHQAVLNQLPPLRKNQRFRISQFLCHLEQRSTPWSTMAPQPLEFRPARLEQAVNDGIAQHGLESGTRSALNAAFGLTLQGPSGRMRLAPILPEHNTLMSQVPASLSAAYVSHVRRFLCHLEQQGTWWSAMAPQHGELRPALLEQAVNDGIAQHGLDSSTRAALNVAFGLALQGSLSRSTPTLQEHQTLLTQLPRPVSQQRRSDISHFLYHLEQRGMSWSLVAPQPGELRPALLEQVVNDGIAQHWLETGTRSALNTAFGLTLQPNRRAPIP